MTVVGTRNSKSTTSQRTLAADRTPGKITFGRYPLAPLAAGFARSSLSETGWLKTLRQFSAALQNLPRAQQATMPQADEIYQRERAFHQPRVFGPPLRPGRNAQRFMNRFSKVDQAFFHSFTSSLFAIRHPCADVQIAGDLS